MNNIDILRVAFRKAKTAPFFPSKLIAWFTKGKFCHTELIFSDGMWFSSTLFTGPRFTSAISGNPDKWVIRAIEVKDEAAIRKWCESILGTRYDLRAILGFILPWWMQDPNKWFCSETTARALSIDGTLPPIVGRVSPNDLYPIILKHSKLLTGEQQ